MVSIQERSLEAAMEGGREPNVKPNKPAIAQTPLTAYISLPTTHSEEHRLDSCNRKYAHRSLKMNAEERLRDVGTRRGDCRIATTFLHSHRGKALVDDEKFTVVGWA